MSTKVLATGSNVLLVAKGKHMSLVDIIILILKLIVAALQLLDAVLKYIK
jgi:small toxic protein TisB